MSDPPGGQVRFRSPGGLVRVTLPLVLVAAGLLGPAAGRAQQAVVTCDRCHADREFLVGKAATAEGEEDLYVPTAALAGTRHAGLACVQCHAGYGQGYPHRTSQVAVPCASCHGEVGADWSASVHAANVQTVGDAPGCVGCHGSHNVLGAEDRASPTHPLNVASLCGGCHGDPEIIGTYFMAPEESEARMAVERYHQTVHGMALTRAGLIVSATCNDCHRAHLVLPADSPRSSVNRAHIAATCGSCHEGVLETYMASAHGEAYRQGRTTAEGEPAPVCVECHSAHEIVRADQPGWFIGVVEECGSCHEHLYETYFETYHGKVTQLGFGLTAKCSDCHTPHAMLPASDPNSTVHPANLVETCSQCHPGANQNFVQYYSHGEPTNREKYPRLFWPWLFMTSLLAGVFLFFGTHTALWLTRVAIERLRGGGHGGGPASGGRRPGDEPAGGHEPGAPPG